MQKWIKRDRQRFKENKKKGNGKETNRNIERKIQIRNEEENERG